MTMTKLDRVRAQRLGRKAKSHGWQLDRDRETLTYVLVSREWDSVVYPADGIGTDLDGIEAYLAQVEEDEENKPPATFVP